MSEAPLIFAVGTPSQRFIVDRDTFDIFVSHLPSNVNIQHSMEGLQRQLVYLSQLLSANGKPPVERTNPIDVVWIGIDPALGTVGGAAGRDAFLANVLLDKGAVAESEMLRLRWISGHELSHMLGLSTGALWATESLAHYYGYKSISDAEGSKALFEDMTAQTEDPIGLLEAQRRVSEMGELRWYGLFYSSGIRFWRSLDDELGRATQGRLHLDDFLSILLREQFGSKGELPTDFSSAIDAVLRKGELGRLTAQYL